MATDQPPVPRSPREQCQCRVGRYRPLEQQTCTDSNLEDSGCTMPTQGLSSPTCGRGRLFSVNSSGCCSAVWLNHVFVSSVKTHICNLWAHGMNPSLILNLLPKADVFKDEYFGRKCVAGYSFHYSCEEAQKAVFLHVAMSSSCLSHACSFYC